MKKLIFIISSLLMVINVYPSNLNDPEKVVDIQGHMMLVPNNSVKVFINGNTLTTVFNTDLRATIVVKKASSAYTRSAASEIISTQTVDAKEFDEVITAVEDYELGAKYIIEIITPEGILKGEFEF